MNALIWTGGDGFRLQEVPTPAPGPRQVLLQVEATAICGSDLHLNDFGAQPPVIPGHEAAGKVAAIGIVRRVDPRLESAPGPRRHQLPIAVTTNRRGPPRSRCSHR